MATLPHGSWPTPITSELVVRSARLPNGVRVDGDDVWWSEGRPEEAGRIAVLRRRPDGSVDDVLPAEHSARTAVHEYGGGAWWVRGGVLWFADWATQRLHRLEVGGSADRAHTGARGAPRAPVRRRRRASRRHLAPLRPGGAPRRRPRGDQHHRAPARPRAEHPRGRWWTGPDFVSDPRWRPDGGAFCWLEWDHPDMPWDATRLVVDDHGARTVVAGADRAGVDRPAPVDARRLALVLRRSNGVLEPVPVDARSGARGRRRPRQGHRLPPVGLRAVHLRLPRRRSGRVLVQRRRPGAPGGAGAGLRSGDGRRPARHVDRRPARTRQPRRVHRRQCAVASPTSWRSTSTPAPSRCSCPRVTWGSTTGGSRSPSPSPSRRPEARPRTGCSTAPPTRTWPHPTESVRRCS